MRADPSSLFDSEPNAAHIRIEASLGEIHEHFNVGFNTRMCLLIYVVLSAPASCVRVDFASRRIRHRCKRCNSSFDGSHDQPSSVHDCIFSTSASAPCCFKVRLDRRRHHITSSCGNYCRTWKPQDGRRYPEGLNYRTQPEYKVQVPTLMLDP